jgi:hypothetical protein
MDQAMRKLILFLSCLVLLTTWTGVAQAVEVGPCPEMSRAAQAQVFCDGDQVPADCEKNCPRHLGCHGHQIATPVAGNLASSGSTDVRVFGAWSAGSLVGLDLDQALRPPQT